MNVTRARSRWVTGCLATTMFFSGAAVRAQCLIAPESELAPEARAVDAGFRWAAPHSGVHPLAGRLPGNGALAPLPSFGDATGVASDRVEAPSAVGPSAPASDNATTPWSRMVFVRLEDQGRCSVVPADERRVPAGSAESPANSPEVQPPGVVQNLSRTDSR